MPQSRRSLSSAGLVAPLLSSTSLRQGTRLGVLAAALAVASGAASAAPVSDTQLFFGCSAGIGSNCVSLTAPIPARLGLTSTLSSRDASAILLEGNGSAISTTVVDLSLDGILGKTNPGSARATAAQLGAAFDSVTHGAMGSLPTQPIDLLVAAADGSYAKSDLRNAFLSWSYSKSLPGTDQSGTTVDRTTLLNAVGATRLKSLLSSEFASIAVAPDGTVTTADASIALSKVLLRTLTVDGVLAKFPDMAGFKSILDHVKVDGSLSLAELAAALPDNMKPTELQLAQMRAILAGREVGGAGSGRYLADDIFLVAESTGEASDLLGHVVTNGATTVALARLVDPLYYQDAYSLSHILAAYDPSVSALFANAQIAASALSPATMRLFVASFADTPANNASITSQQLNASRTFASVYAHNTAGAVTLTNEVAITVSGTTGLAGLAARTDSGAVSLTNNATISVASDNAGGVSGRSTGGTVVVANSGDVTLTGANGSAVRAGSETGDASVTNSGRVRVTGSGNAGLKATSTSGAARTDNSGTVTVEGAQSVALVASSISGAATATNTGRLSATGANSIGFEAFSTSGAASGSNSGSVVASGTRAGGMAVFSTSGAVSLANSGDVTVSGDGSWAVDAASQSNSADVVNDGRVGASGINATGLGAQPGSGNITITNNGSVAVDGAHASGINVGQLDFSAQRQVLATTTITNAGSVSAGGDKGLGVIAFAYAGALTNAATGSITASGDHGVGVVIGLNGQTGEARGDISISNLGTITGGGGSGSLAASFAADHMVDFGSGAGVVLLSLRQDQAGQIAFTNAGTISAASGLAIGTVEGTVAVPYTNPDGSTGSSNLTFAPTSVALTNSGTLTGDVRLGSAADSVTNTGRINGTLDLGAGDDVFSIAAGSSFRTAIGGSGIDTLVLTGSGPTVGRLDGATLSGFERGRKIDSGDWILSGAMASTDWSIERGRVAIDGSVGNVLMAPGTTLYGSGTTGSLMAAGATLLPGDTFANAGVGRLAVGGNLVLNANSIVVVDVQKSSADQIAVGGTATLGNATLAVRGKDVVGGGVFDVVTAGGGVSGRFAPSVKWTDSAWNFLTLQVDYLSGSVKLTVVDPVQSAKTTMPSESKTFLTSVFGETPKLGSGDQATAYQLIGNSIAQAGGNSGQIRNTMDQVGGRSIVAASGAGLEAVKAVDSSVSRASDAAVGGSVGPSSGVTMAYLDDPAPSPAHRAIAAATGTTQPTARVTQSPHWIAWTTGNYGFGSASNGTTTSDFRSGGLTVGIIDRIDQAFSVGFAGGYTRSDVDVANPASHVGVGSYNALVHGTYDTPTLRFDALVGYAFQDYSSRRTVLGLNASGSYQGNSVRGSVDAGYKFPVGASVFMPFVGVDLIHSHTGGYTESGAGVLDLSVASSDTTSVDSRLGVKWSARYTLGNVVVSPNLAATWIHSWGDAASTVHASMVGSSFTIVGAERAREALGLTAGLTSEIGSQTSLYGRYSGRLSRDLTAHDFSAGVRYQW